MLEVTQGRGTFVLPVSSDTDGVIRHLRLAERQSLAHLFEARLVLEPRIAALAAERATDAEIAAIVETAQEQSRLHAAGEDFLDPDVRFHELIVTAAHNPVIGRMLSAVNELLLESRRRTMRIGGAAEKAVSYHLLVARAIRDRKPDQARELMEHHVWDVAHDASEADQRRRARSRPGPRPTPRPTLPGSVSVRALVFEGPWVMPLHERPELEAGPGDVVVAVRAAGICGSDVHGYIGTTGRRRPGIVMGHEAAGIVSRVGEGVTSVAVGDRVALRSVQTCGRCEPCRSGRPSICAERQVLGMHLDGAYADAVRLPGTDRSCHSTTASPSSGAR